MAGGAPTTPDAPRPIQLHEQNAELRRAGGLSETDRHAGATPEQQRRLKLVDAHIAAKEGNNALRELAHVPEKFKHETTYEKTIDYMVSDTATKDKLKKDMGAYKEYMKGLAFTDESAKTPPGYTVDQKRDLLRSQVRNLLLADTALRVAYADGSGVIDDAKLDSILANPKLRDAVTRRLNEAFDPKHLAQKDALDTAEGNVKNADKAKDHWKEELRRAKERHDVAQKAEDEFNKDPYWAGKTKNVLLKELQVDGDVKRFQAAQERFQRILDKGVHPTSSAYGAAEKELADARAVDPAKIAEFEALRSEYIAMQQERKEASSQFTTADAEYTRSEAALAAATSARDKLQLEKDGVGNEFTAAVTDAIGETARAQIVTDALARLKDYATYDNEINTQLREQGEKELQQFLDARYTRVDQKGILFRENQFRINKAVADKDLNQLIAIADNAAKNPAARIDVQKNFVKYMLIQSKMSPEMQKQLLEDPAFIKGQFEAMVKKAYVMHEGGKAEYSLIERSSNFLARDDATVESRMKNFFTKHPAGQELSINTINSNPEVKAKVEEIIQGPVDKDTMKKLEEKKKGSGMLAMLLALGVTALSVGDLVADDEGVAAAA